MTYTYIHTNTSKRIQTHIHRNVIRWAFSGCGFHTTRIHSRMSMTIFRLEFSFVFATMISFIKVCVHVFICQWKKTDHFEEKKKPIIVTFSLSSTKMFSLTFISVDYRWPLVKMAMKLWHHMLNIYQCVHSIKYRNSVRTTHYQPHRPTMLMLL